MKVPGARPYFPEADLPAVLDDVRAVLRSGVLTSGVYTGRFEEEFAKYLGVKHAVLVNSGTAALEIALRSLGVGEGDEVIVPTNTFLSSANAVIFAGGRPVLADIDSDTLCIDLNDVRKRLTEKTVGVMVVHIAGLVCPQIEALSDLCGDKKLFLIEDAAHAHGAIFNGRKAGSFGEAGCFSFYPTKVMTTGEGGMVCTNREDLFEQFRLLRNHGTNSMGLQVELGYNWRLSEVNAVLGVHQLRRLEEFIEKRNVIAEMYQEGLDEVDGIVFFEVPKQMRHSYYKFPVKLRSASLAKVLVRKMRDDYDVELGRVYYPPCHLEPLYVKLFGYTEGSFPVAEEVLKRTVCLPIYVQMQKGEVDYVIDSLKKALARLS